jgi:choline dehydrogenase-like flavoprotein
MGSKRRDWRFKSAPQKALTQRKIANPGGHMLGGSSSINSRVDFVVELMILTIGIYLVGDGLM